MKKYFVRILMLLIIVISGCGKDSAYIDKVKKLNYNGLPVEEEMQRVSDILEVREDEIYKNLCNVSIMDGSLIVRYINDNDLKYNLRKKFTEAYNGKIVSYDYSDVAPRVITNEFLEYIKSGKIDDLTPPKVEIEWEIEGNTEYGKVILVKSKNYKIRIETIDNGDFPEIYSVKYYNKKDETISVDDINQIIYSLNRIVEIRDKVFEKALNQRISIENLNEDNIKFAY